MAVETQGINFEDGLLIGGPAGNRVGLSRAEEEK